MNNPKINEELKEEKNVEIMCKDIFYKEGILEILEKNININYIIIDEKLPGEINLNNLIKKIIEINEKIKIIITIKKLNKNNFKKIKEKKLNKLNLINKNKINKLKKMQENKFNNFEEEKEEEFNYLKNNKIIKIYYEDKINLDKIKNYKIKNYTKNNDKKNSKNNIEKIKNKEILFLGERQVGKSIVIASFAYKLAIRNKKILIVDLNENNSCFYLIFGTKKYNKKILKNKIKIKNKYQKNNNKLKLNYLNEEIIKNLIIKINNNIDLISYNKLIKYNLLKNIENNYNYILIEINLEKNNLKNKEIINNIKEKILIIKPNLLGIKNSEKIIIKNKLNNFKIIINNYNEYSINKKIIENIFRKNEIIGKINYKKEYDEIVNKNFKVNKNLLKSVLKDFEEISL